MTRPVLPDVIPAGTRLDGWQIVEFLDEGGEGRLYRVRSLADPRHFGALKIRRPDGISTRETFLAEAAFVRSQPIPGFMPRWFADGVWEGEPYYVMELTDPLPRCLTFRRAFDTLDRLVEAVEALHRAGYYHGDLKPKNLGRIEGRVVLLDFGSLRPRLATDALHALTGTRAYMADELRAEGRTSRHSEIYALGCTLRGLCGSAARTAYAALIEQATDETGRSPIHTLSDFRRALRQRQAAFSHQLVRHLFLRKFKLRLILGTSAAVCLLGAALAAGYVATHRRDKIILSELQRDPSPVPTSPARCDDAVSRSNLERWVDAARRENAQAKDLAEEGLRLYAAREYARAFDLLSRAAEDPACTDGRVFGKLAECYLRGRGCAADEKKSALFAQRAVSFGDETGSRCLRPLALGQDAAKGK